MSKQTTLDFGQSTTVPGKENQSNKEGGAKAGGKKKKTSTKKKSNKKPEKLSDAEKITRNQLLQTYSIPKRFFCNGSYDTPHDFHTLQQVQRLAASWERDVNKEGTFVYYQARPNCPAVKYVKDLCPNSQARAAYKSANLNNGMREYNPKGNKVASFGKAGIILNIAVMQFMDRVHFSQDNVAHTECISKEADIITEYQRRGWANLEQGQHNIKVMVRAIETWDEGDKSDESDKIDEIDTTCQTAYNQLKKEKVLVSRWDAKQFWHHEIGACAGRYQRRYLVLQLIQQIIFELE